MNTLRTQRGFAIVELAIVLLVVTIIGFVGYRVWQANHPIASQSDSNVATQVAPINTVADLEKTDSDIQSLNVEGSDINDLDAQLDY